MNTYLKASNNPLDDINAITYAGQDLQNRMYKSGYEEYFEMLPALADDTTRLQVKLEQTKLVMDALATELAIDPWTPTLQPLPGKFNRTIIGMESPSVTGNTYKEGAEIVVSRWGDGFTSPVHGHADGYLYEQLLRGKMRVNTYRIVDPVRGMPDPVYRVARPVQTRIYKDYENIAAIYTAQQQVKRSALLHNFTSIGYSVAVHYLPEHARDGRDNTFAVDYFEDYHSDFHYHAVQLTPNQGIQELRIGDVALVRSQNVPDYGDHFIIITGKPILKEHGLRPQEVAVHAPNAARVLDAYEPIMGVTLLKLAPIAQNAFYRFHGIGIVGDKVTLPTV